MKRETAERQRSKLKQGDLEAWTLLLRRHIDHPRIAVVSVVADAVNNKETRFTLTLDNHSDPITLLGRAVSARAADFHQTLNPHIAFLAPHCWFVYRGDDENWVLLDDVPHDRSAENWSKKDALAMVGDLAEHHSDFWNRHDLLSPQTWLPFYIGSTELPAKNDSEHENKDVRSGTSDWDKDALTHQAVRSTNQLAVQWQAADEGLKAMMAIDGWPGVLDERHLRAAADLIDDPLPILHHLRNLPITLLHGYPGIYNWRISGLGSRHLVDWSRVAIGPAVCDLVIWQETFGLLQQGQQSWQMRTDWAVTDETMTDYYILTLKDRLGATFDAREFRRAIPAARCLFILLNWFPRFGRWLNKLPEHPATRRDIWRVINHDAAAGEASAVYSPILSLRPYLADTFHRFIRASYQL